MSPETAELAPPEERATTPAGGTPARRDDAEAPTHVRASDIEPYIGLRYLSTLTGIAFLSHQAGSFLGAWGGGYLFDLMGSYDLAWKIGVFIGLVAGTMQLLMNDRPTARMQALHAAAA